MKIRGRKLLVVLLTVGFMLSASFSAFAMGMGGGGTGGMGGGGTVANRFSGFGTVTAVDVTAKTVTVSITMASKLLKNDVGNEVTFHVSSTAWVGSMVMGGMMSQAGANHSQMMGGNTQLTLSQIKVGDQVGFMGALNTTSKEYYIDRLMDWLY